MSRRSSSAAESSKGKRFKASEPERSIVVRTQTAEYPPQPRPTLDVELKWIKGGDEGVERWEKRFKKVSIITGAHIDYNSFEDGMDIYGLLSNMGWCGLFHDGEKIYEDSVRLFYCHLARIEGGGLYSEVFGQEIIITPSVLEDALGIPNGGDVLDKGLTIPAGKTRERFYKVVCGNRSTKPNSTNLLPEPYFIHRIIAHNLIPKKGNYDAVTERALSLMYFIYNKIAINLPVLMLEVMIDAAEDSNKSLPYAMLLTKIFRHFDVNLNEEKHLHDIPAPIVYKVITRRGKSATPSARDSGAEQSNEIDELQTRVRHLQIEQSRDRAAHRILFAGLKELHPKVKAWKGIKPEELYPDIDIEEDDDGEYDPDEEDEESDE